MTTNQLPVTHNPTIEELQAALSELLEALGLVHMARDARHATSMKRLSYYADVCLSTVKRTAGVSSADFQGLTIAFTNLGLIPPEH